MGLRGLRLCAREGEVEGVVLDCVSLLAICRSCIGFSRKHPVPALCATFSGNALLSERLGVPKSTQPIKIHLAVPASPGAALSGVLVGIQRRGSPHRGPWAQPPAVSRGLRVRQGLLLLRGGAPDALVRARRGREGEGGAWASLARRLHAATREARQGGAAEPRGEARTSDCVVLAPDGVHTSVYRALGVPRAVPHHCWRHRFESVPPCAGPSPTRRGTCGRPQAALLAAAHLQASGGRTRSFVRTSASRRAARRMPCPDASGSSGLGLGTVVRGGRFAGKASLHSGSCHGRGRSVRPPPHKFLTRLSSLGISWRAIVALTALSLPPPTFPRRASRRSGSASRAPRRTTSARWGRSPPRRRRSGSPQCGS